MVKILQEDEAEQHETFKEIEAMTNAILAVFGDSNIDLNVGMNAAMNAFIQSFHAYFKTEDRTFSEALRELEEVFDGLRESLRINWDKSPVPTGVREETKQ